MKKIKPRQKRVPRNFEEKNYRIENPMKIKNRRHNDRRSNNRQYLNINDE